MFRFSLIVATLGRKNEFFEFLESITLCAYSLNSIEVVVVDQNKKGYLDNLLKEFSCLDIKYIHSNKKGLSYNRNLGLKYATGNIICFPDDDCKFYENTFQEVLDILSKSDVDFCLGRIYDRERKKNIIKDWPSKVFSVNKLNSYFVNSSITMFLKKEFVLNFDENLGVGARFGSCEDADFIYRLLQSKARGIYTPKIEIWHPEPNFQDISLIKVKDYASGFGYFARKNIDIFKVILFFLLLAKKTYQLVVNLFNKRFQNGYFSSFFSGLFLGVLYKKKSR